MTRAAALLCMLALAGCGGAERPRLPQDLAQRLRADALACRKPELRAAAIAAINAHRVPAELQEPLLSRVNALAARCDPRRARELDEWLAESSG